MKSFDEEFPSLKGKRDIAKNYGNLVNVVSTAEISEHCLDKEEVSLALKELAGLDVYRALGKVKVWSASNDEVVDLTHEFIVDWLKLRLKL